MEPILVTVSKDEMDKRGLMIIVAKALIRTHRKALADQYLKELWKDNYRNFMEITSKYAEIKCEY